MPDRPLPSTKPVPVKLLFKPGMRALIVNAPAGYADQFAGPIDTSSSGSGEPYEFAQLFSVRKDEVLAEAPKVRDAVAANGIAWFSYPKAKALSTDLNRDILAGALLDLGLQVVTQVAIDDTWSALRAKKV